MPGNLTIALDAMGGDNAPESVILGAKLALKKHPELHFIFVGDEPKLTSLLQAHPLLAKCSSTKHAEMVIADDEKPSIALRKGKQSSMQIAINTVKSGEAHAVVSGGNTGALMAMAKLAFRMLPGINRPAAASLFPTETGEVVMLDLGANIEASAEELFQFAIMGDAYAKAVLEKENPRVGLLNVGEEDTKGHPEIREAAELLKNSELTLNYTGFVEGNHIPTGRVDVVVSDGFSGNIMLKTAEGTAKLIRKHIKDAFNSNWVTRLSYLLASETMRQLKKRLDSRRYNGAMFLGLNGVAVKSHGRSDDYAFSFAIRTAVDLLKKKANDRIIEQLKSSGVIPQEESSGKAEMADAS
jgi:glycerol-3-phosphate acyltransferase PlsX